MSLKRDKTPREKPIILLLLLLLLLVIIAADVAAFYLVTVKLKKQITLCLFSCALFFSAGHFIIISLH